LDHRNRPFFAGFQDAGQHFLTIESLAPSVFFDGHVRDFVDAFVAREAPLAFQTLAAPANRIAFLAFARVHDLVVEMTAKGTFHMVSSPRRSFNEVPVNNIYIAAIPTVGM